MMRELQESEILRIKESFLENKDEIQLSESNIETDLQIDLLSGGSSNINYRVKCKKNSKKFFVKHQTIPPISINYSNNLEREFTVAKYLSKPSIDLSPRPYYLDIKRKIMVTDFVRGYHPKIHDKNIGKILRQIGMAISKFRKFPPELLQFLNTGTRICPREFFHKVIKPSIYKMATQSLFDGSSSFYQFLEEIQSVLLQRLEYEPNHDCTVDWSIVKDNPGETPFGLIHNDLAFRNIIVKPNYRLSFIDFEFADFGDLAYDLAYLISENQLLDTQSKIIIQNCELNPRILDRTNRYIKIFLPLLELANAHWTLNHISKVISGDHTMKDFQLPSTISQNLEYVKWKIRRLASILPLKSPIFNEHQIFFEIQDALKIFETQILISGK
ncbi:MAG: hypothetical protein HeimC3_10130 [Candidatus Heimdallarchaeota archaeon LC_3]|nr:MAG: hypothetical protein HeimC3_10130 [Candidatus Heimdallarchaeota archaeon LC_3]